MKLIIRSIALLKAFLSLRKFSSGKKIIKPISNTFQIMEDIRFDEFGNPDFTYK